jgi:hypothetical protein
VNRGPRPRRFTAASSAFQDLFRAIGATLQHCFGTLPHTLQHRSSLSPRQLHGRQMSRLIPSEAHAKATKKPQNGEQE